MNATKFAYNHGKMKDCENQSSTRKKGSFKKLMKPDVVEEKSMMMLQDKKRQCQKAYETCRFWMILMITRLRKRWRTTRFWVWLQPQQDFEAPGMEDQNAALQNFEPGCSHSTILRSKRWRKNQDFERHCSLAERYQLRRWREKSAHPDGLVG